MVSPHNRRDFLAYSAQTVGALPTLLGSSWLFAADVPAFASGLEFKHLRPQDQSILAVLLPIALGVELDPKRPEDQQLLAQTMKGLDHVIDQLSERHREDLMLLLSLLSMPVTRAVLGVWSKWENASRDEVLIFLDRWERNVLSLKRFGYQSLVQLMECAFYAVRGHSAKVEYPDIPASIQPLLKRFARRSAP